MFTHGATPTRVAMAVLAIAALLATRASAQQSIDGAWELKAYDSPASVGKASGLLTLSAGRFSLVYTMEEPGGGTSGRAHAGRFRHEDQTLALDVDWTMDYIKGKGQAHRGGNSRRTVRTALAGDKLTLTYENGSVQQFQRVAPAPQ
jgi:hypothetical protein